MWLRIFFVIITCFAGAAFGWSEGRPIGGFLFGLGASGLAVTTDVLLRRVSPWSLFGGTLGLLCGVAAAYLITIPLVSVQAIMDYHLDLLLYVILGFSGLSIGLSTGEGFSLSRLVESFQAAPPEGMPKLVDTSAIIDGRIADVCETRFVEGPFLIPQFVLRELQHIADSEDPKKRARGRRGLDILRRMQKSSAVEVRIVDNDFPRIREVDEKLVALARTLGARLVTTDYNLNKVCEVQGIGVLNVNDLANALRAVVLPGEVLRVQITKEGKEPQQGVAYLDDGTMVVIENGASLMGKKLDVTVTSVLQTAAGRMIFSKPRDENQIREEAA